MGLDGQVPLRRQIPQESHQLVGARGGEPGGQHGLDVGKIPAGVQPAESLPLGFLGGLLQHAGGGVAVHVHLAHIAGDARLFQLVHQDESGVGVEGGEHAHPGGAVGHQLMGQPAVNFPGVVRVREPGLRGEGVGVQPVQQGQVHAHAQHGVLGGVEVQVREGLQNQGVVVVLHGRARVLLRQGGEYPLNDAAFGYQVAVLCDIQLAQRPGGDDGSFQDRDSHTKHLSYEMSAKTSCAI